MVPQVQRRKDQDGTDGSTEGGEDGREDRRVREARDGELGRGGIADHEAVRRTGPGEGRMT